MANEWPLVGLILALELLYAAGVALWTRWASEAKLQGQTIWHVAVGVAGVVSIAGLRIGFGVSGFLLICFTVAGIPMAIEYFERVQEEQRKAQKVLESNVDASADRKE